MALWCRLLIATTKKSAKGESVFTKLKPLWPLAQGLFMCAGSLFEEFKCSPKEAFIQAWPAHRDCQDPTSSHSLFGSNGELVELRIPVEPRHLEDLLEALASLDFPVNPELFHQPGVVNVEFPAYAGHVEEVRNVLREAGFDPGSLQVLGILQYQVSAG